MPRIPALCLLTVTAVGLPAQTTHLVGPGGFPQIRDAIAAAAPGDVVVVQPGTYWNFTLDKGLVLRALVPGTVDVGFDTTTPLIGYTRFTAPANEPIDVVGLRFLPSMLAFPILHRVEVLSGRVRFDTCELRSRGNALRSDGADVSLQSCVVEEVDPPALDAVIRNDGGTLTIVDSQVLGATNSSLAFGSAISSIEMYGGTLHACGSFVRGSVLTGLGGTAAIAGLTSSSVWVIDSSLAVEPGACTALVPVRIGRTQAVGAPCATNLVAMADPLGVSRPQPPTLGAPFTLDFRTQPNGFVGVFASFDARINGIPLTEQPGMLDPGSLTIAGLLLTDMNGDGSITWQLPNVPALRDTQLWLQGVGGTTLTLPLQASPLVGGVLR